MKKKNKQKFYSKEIKRNKNVNEDVQKAITFFVVLIITLVLFGLLYFLNGKYVTKDLFQDETTTKTTEVSYDPTVITISRLFDIKDSEYYVMMYDASNELNGFLYENLVVGFKEDKVKLYSIDMSNAMNSKYYDEDGKENTKPTKSSEVMVTRPTLVLIKKGKVVEYITDQDTIIKTLTKNNGKN